MYKNLYIKTLKYILLFAVYFFTGRLLLAQENGINYGYPLIQNFDDKDYPAENVNWFSTQDGLGNMFFANNFGVLEFNGNKWEAIGTKSEAVSIWYDAFSKTIYVGCVDDFGYLKLEDNGKYIFVSLSEKLNLKEKIGNVWDCFSTSEGVYFLVEKKLIRYKNGKFKIWESQSTFHTAFKIGEKIFIRETGTGILCLENDLLTFVKGSEIFAEIRVDFMGKFSNKANEYVLYSREKGLFKFSLSKSNPDYSINLRDFDGDISKLLDQSVVYRGLILKNNDIAFSTLVGGVIVINQDGKLVNHLNTKNGLNCDIINHTFEDNQGNLWLSTENGISLIMNALPTYNYNKLQNINGIAVSSLRFNNKIYVATSTGVYVHNTLNNIFDKVDLPTTQVWHLAVAENESAILASTARGIYEITKNTTKMLSADYGNIFLIYKSKKSSNLYFACHYNGIFAFTYINGKYSLLGDISNINSQVLNVVEDNKGNLLLSTQNDGIYYVETSKMHFTNKKAYVNFIQFNLQNGLPSLNYNYVAEINGEIVISTYNGLYHFNKKVDLSKLTLKEISELKLVRYKKLDPYFQSNDIQISKKVVEDESKNLWITSTLPSGTYELATRNFKNKTWDFQPFKLISKQRIHDIYPDSRHVWFGGTDIIYAFDTKKSYNYKLPYNCFIHAVISNADTVLFGNYHKKINFADSIANNVSLFQPKELNQSFDYKNNDFTFNFAANSYIANNPCKFSCYLEGEDEKWSDWSAESSKLYMNLYEGSYIFKVKAKNIFGTESNIATYEFRILPPWYRTTLAYILYFVLAFVFVYGVVVVYTRNLNRIIKTQTAELQHQKDEIVHKNKEITDSIYYAKRIQDAIMPSNEYIKNMFEDSFVFFKPKDIVSGDFYWANLRENSAILAAVDCTGHGVPGAFMSMMGNDYLNDIIVDSKINEPNEILNRMRSGIIKALKQRGESGESKDGMDMALVNINKDTLILEYAGANNPLYIVRDKNQIAIENANVFATATDKNILYEIKGNKFPVGIHMGTTLQPFSKREIQLLIGDVVYMFSDGYADQFGGPSSKKLKYNQFKKYILESMFLTMEEQKIYLEQKLNEWQGDLEQVDDVLVMGVRIV